MKRTAPCAAKRSHFANPEKADSYATYAKKMDYYQVDYDVFATSYYPYWHGTLDNLSAVLTDIADTYGKKVMVVETSYAYTDADSDFSGNTISGGSGIIKDYPFTPQGQANCIRNITDTVVNRTPAGIGKVLTHLLGSQELVQQDKQDHSRGDPQKPGKGFPQTGRAGQRQKQRQHHAHNRAKQQGAEKRIHGAEKRKQQAQQEQHAQRYKQDCQFSEEHGSFISFRISSSMIRSFSSSGAVSSRSGRCFRVAFRLSRRRQAFIFA